MVSVLIAGHRLAGTAWLWHREGRRINLAIRSTNSR
ncbi:hypothetical protein JOE48_000249 [Methylobacterium sp. PvR107]|nr:hypothetical protein [Methylobacterium sp. PvR107]